MEIYSLLACQVVQTMISGNRETQRIGVGIDLEKRPTCKGIQEGRDELLVQAVARIRDSK